MRDVHTHYDNLKIARNAPPEVIRAAYKALAQKYHPDKHAGSDSAAKVLLLINEAYAVLSDPRKKARHDAWINTQVAEITRLAPAQEATAALPKRRWPRMAWVAVSLVLAFGLGMVLAIELPGVGLHGR